MLFIVNVCCVVDVTYIFDKQETKENAPGRLWEPEKRTGPPWAAGCPLGARKTLRAPLGRMPLPQASRQGTAPRTFSSLFIIFYK